MKALDLIFAARPLLHLPVWSIFLVALYYHHELSGESFGGQNLLMLGCLSLLGAGACYLNQVYDCDSDRMNNKCHFLQRGLVSERTMMIGFVATSLLALALSVTISFLAFFICVQLLALGYLYSAPPVRLKDRPIGGFMANAYGIGFIVPFAVFPKMQADTAGLLGWDNPFYFFCAVGSIYILTCVSDQYGDAAAGKRTIAVVTGFRVSHLLALLLMLVAALCAFQSEYPMLLGLAIIAAAAIVVACRRQADAAVRLAAKLPIILLTALAGWFYPIYLIFVVVLILVTRIYYARRFGMQYPELA
ncbi:MAG: UbiA family prenyltransferase [candidate division Zixibacteria bacterium]|nr:UbiA family prenyltransferase [candidate division Zixibacteria bacterium]